MAAEGDFDVFYEGVGREVEKVGEVYAGFEFDVVDGAGDFVVEMAVFVEIGTVARGFAVEVDLADDAVLDEGLEAVVNSGEGYGGEDFFDPHEDLVGVRVIPFGHEDAVNFLPLPGHPEAVDFLRGVGFFLAC